MKKEFAISVVFILVALADLFAQSPAKLREKYGSADQKGRYTVRPNIGLTATYDSDRKLLEMMVKLLDDGTQADQNKPQLRQTMRTSVARQILDEIVPSAQRGKLLQSLSYESGCFSRETNQYENVTTKVANRCQQQGGGTYSVQVLWEKTKP